MTCSLLDLKQNFGGRNPGPLLTGAGKGREGMEGIKGRGGMERTEKGREGGMGKRGGKEGPAAGGSCSKKLRS